METSFGESELRDVQGHAGVAGTTAAWPSSAASAAATTMAKWVEHCGAPFAMGERNRIAEPCPLGIGPAGGGRSRWPAVYPAGLAAGVIAGTRTRRTAARASSALPAATANAAVDPQASQRPPSSVAPAKAARPCTAW